MADIVILRTKEIYVILDLYDAVHQGGIEPPMTANMGEEL